MGADEIVGIEGSSLTAARKRRVGVVAIGRNEGARLQRCLRSLPSDIGLVAYVDSGSTDGSVAFARSLGVEIIELDMSVPFTAARARNAGVEHLRGLARELDCVLVLDGDCELVPGFLDAALLVMDAEPSVAVVCGRRREIEPTASIYNRLCDMEWNTHVGDVDACGGDALLRLAAFDEVGGYNPAVIAGEEPELCMRLRAAGHKIRRIDRDMTRHDAAVHHASQWWKRNVRAGHACAEVFHRHPNAAFEGRAVRSNAFWGLGLPTGALAGALPTGGLSLLSLGLYGRLWWQIRAHRMREHGDSPNDATLYAHFCTAGKVPQALGMLQFHANRIRGRRTGLIEYKRPPS